MATALVDIQEALPSHLRVVPGSVNVPVAKFPSNPKSTDSTDPAKIASDLVKSFNKSIVKQDFAGISKLFTEDGYWRDHLALSWAFRTAQSPSNIERYLQQCANSRDGFRLKKLAIDESTSHRKPQIISLDGFGEVSVIQFFVSIETAIGTAEGVVRLGEEGGTWKIFTLYTVLDQLEGHPEGINERRPNGVEHGGKPGRQNWAERREDEANMNVEEPVVIIVGIGQAGLTIAARLKMLGVHALVVDQNERVGDNWRKRYHQLVLHDPIWYDHLPYLKFPAQWPIFTPKDKLGDWFESYAKLMELNVWMSTDLEETTWDKETQLWTVKVNRRSKDGTSESRTFHPRHLIQATGHSGKKNMPDIKGIENFKGHLLSHSSEFPGARKGKEGTKAIVVGCCNSGHDISQDFLEKGYDITIVQRSSTHVVSSKSIMDISLALYSEGGPSVEDADLMVQGLPAAVLKAVNVRGAQQQAADDDDIIRGLDRVGFKTDGGPDGAGLFQKYLQRGGGYYIDVGASKLIADGKIKIKQGQEIVEVLPNGLRFADGVELEADEIVFATGYQNMRTQTRIMFGDDVADQVKDVWGFNDEGEMRTIWQDSGHPGFWFHGGNLALCRYYSKLLALQILGREEGLYNPGEI